jgi:aryl-alcohol dehydrogenase-like predicted oxidoreductase
MIQVSRRQFLGSAALLAIAASAGRAWQPGAKAALEKRRLGNTDMDVTILGFGGAEIGFQNTEAATIEKLLNSALDAGLNVIDTAECYADSEEEIGRAVGHRRKEYYLFTKVGHAFGRSAEGWTADSIAKSIDRSLERLKCEHVDLVQLHSCDKATLEKGECIQALEKAKKVGKTRYIGYSGDSDAALFAVKSGRFDTLQTSVNFADQECIDLTLPAAREKNIGVIAKRPIANAAWRKR